MTKFNIPRTAVQGSYDEYLSYDSNRNIKTLQRYGEREDAALTMLIDDLKYGYDTGNKLLNVTDEEVHPSGFNDGNVHTQTNLPDFVYDAAGNLIRDRNKKITAITYNHLNQPKEIMVSNETYSGSISYLYDAQGNKLQKQVMEGQALTTTDYLGGFQYLDGKLDFIPHAEGYVKAVNTGGTTEYHYVYNYTDHTSTTLSTGLGNIRLSYGRDPETDEVAILKENHYYPFGLEHQGYVGNHRVFEPRPEGLVSLVPVRNYLDDSYRYSFGSKEEQPELGLNWMDFHARNYMPDIVRTMTMDPLAEKFVSLSPYSFLNNNPLSNIDPTGASTIELTGAAAQEFIERLKNEINSKRDNEEERDILAFDFDYEKYNVIANNNSSKDCDGCPSTFRHKNRKVITNLETGRDYILYDSKWHQLPEQKLYQKFYEDKEHPDGGITLTRTREQLFIESYDAKTINNSFFKGASDFGASATILDYLRKGFKISPFTAIISGASNSFKNAKDLYDRMEDHDKEVERNLKTSK